MTQANTTSHPQVASRFVDDPEDWSLGEFLNEHGYQPSKTRFYIVFKGTSRHKV